MTKFTIPALLSACISTIAFADHGPGTSGSGVNTETAETLPHLRWSAAFRNDWTEFDSVGDDAAVGKEHFDFIDRSFLTTLSVGFGITDNLQIGLAFGYYQAEGSRQLAHSHSHEETASTTEPVVHVHEDGSVHEHEAEATDAPEEAEHEEPAIESFDPDGWTDLWLTAKYRVYRGPLGQFAFIGGLKFPIGEDEVTTSAGNPVEPASTAGSGAWDGLFGAAYTQSLSPNVAVDASVQYTVRGEAHDYRLGNRFDAGVALGWRFWGGAQGFPQASFQAEATLRSAQKSKASEVREDSTGGTVLFLSPGVRVRFNEHAALSVGVHLPVVQDLNGDQVETDFRVTSSLNISF